MAEKKSFAEKVLTFREEIAKQDWSPDGENVSQNYKYLSNQKMKANVMKALVKSGLEWRIDYSDLQIMPAISERMTQHFIVKAVATISDPSTDDEIRWIAYGEAADIGDKAISKMQTNAFKNIIANNLLVAELSVEGEDMIESIQSAKDSGKSGYAAKKEVAKEMVLKNQTPEPKTLKGQPTSVQQTVMDKILNKAKTVDEISLVPFGTVDEIEERYRNVKSSEDAAQFISEFKGVVSLQ